MNTKRTRLTFVNAVKKALPGSRFILVFSEVGLAMLLLTIRLLLQPRHGA